jgi:starvation-inducible DNA-binding protein
MSQQQRQMGASDTKTNLYATAVNLPEETRIQVIQALNQALADTMDLQSQAKFAHWNVKGYDSYQLHLLFDEIAETLSGHVDVLGERITALGGQAMGTTRIAAKTSKLPQPPENAVGEDEYVEWLTDHVAHHANSLRAFIERAADLGDEDTADLFTELSREVDTQLYFLESRLQATVKKQVPATTGRGASSQSRRASMQGGSASRISFQQSSGQQDASRSTDQPSGAREGLTQVMDSPQPMSPQSSVPRDAGQPMSAQQGIPGAATQPTGSLQDTGSSIGEQQPAPRQGPPQQPPGQPLGTPPARGQQPQSPPIGAPSERGQQPVSQQRQAPQGYSPQLGSRHVGQQAPPQQPPSQPIGGPQAFGRQASSQQSGGRGGGSVPEAPPSTFQQPQGFRQPPGGSNW